MNAARHHLHDSILPLLLALIIGALAGLGAVIFRWLLATATDLIWPGSGSFADQYQQAGLFLRLGVPLAAGLLLGPVLARLAPETRGPGVPEVMAALALRDGIIRHRVTAVKSLATALFIAAGCSVGREGPIVQIGASIGSSLTQLFRLGPEHRRLAVACGAAAGIAATFQAPMAGTMFAVEILLFDLEIGLLSNIVVAAVTGTVVARLCWSRETVFLVPFFQLHHPGELLLYFCLGLAAGLFSLLFMAAVFGFTRLLEKGRLPPWLMPALGGLGVGLIGLAQPQVLAVGYTTINDLLSGQILLSAGLLLLFGKLAATACCVGSGMSGGIFAPSLFLGACLGSLFGHLASLIWPDSPLSPAHYALVGMGAVVAGTTLAPITAILTIFEMTYNYEVVLPLMSACIPAIVVVRLLHGASIYETKLLSRGIRLVRGHDVNRLRELKVRDFLCRNFVPLRTWTDFHDLVEMMTASPSPHFVVLDEHDRLAGVLSLRDIRSRLVDPDATAEKITAADLMTREVVTIREDQNLEEAFHLFSRGRFFLLPVVKKENPEQVLGCLRKDDLLDAYERHILRQQAPAASRWVCPLPPDRKQEN